MSSKTLYVGNLSYSATEQDLRDLFASYDPSDIRIIGDKGFGFVDVPADRAAEAVAGTNMKEVRGRAVKVDEARPRPSGGAPRSMGPRSRDSR